MVKTTIGANLPGQDRQDEPGRWVKIARRNTVSGVGEAIEALGATVKFLPAYSPDLNPIERAFAKIKALLRTNALRTVAALWNALGGIAASIPPEECRNFFRHAGYFWSG